MQQKDDHDIPTDAPPVPTIQNVVATFDTACKIDLGKMAMQCSFVQYQPKRFAAAIIRLTNPQTTCLLFESGKAVCTGAASEQLSCTACLGFVLLLQTNGFKEACFREFRVQNIVAAVNCPFNLDLSELADSVSGFCSYEPTLFPGLVYRVQVASGDCVATETMASSHALQVSKSVTDHNHKVPTTRSANEVVFVCFQSGKCIITGAKDRKFIGDTWDFFFRTVLLSYTADVNIGSSSRDTIFENKSNASIGDDMDLLVRSITSSAADIMRRVAYTTARTEGSILDGFRDACIYADCICAQGVDIADAASCDLETNTDVDTDVARLVRDVQTSDNIPIHAWIAPQVRHAKRLHHHILRLGIHDDLCGSESSGFSPLNPRGTTD